MERQAEAPGPWAPGSRTGRGGQEAGPANAGTRKLLPALREARSHGVAREPSARGLGRRAKGRVIPITAPGVIQACSSPLGCRKPGEVKGPATPLTPRWASWEPAPCPTPSTCPLPDPASRTTEVDSWDKSITPLLDGGGLGGSRTVHCADLGTPLSPALELGLVRRRRLNTLQPSLWVTMGTTCHLPC